MGEGCERKCSRQAAVSCYTTRRVNVDTLQNQLATALRAGARSCLGLWLAASLPLAALGAEESYIVKRGDTLFGIARSYGISFAELAEHNSLSRSVHIYSGQRLMIPQRAEAEPATESGSEPPRNAGRSPLPASVRRAIENAEVKPGRWRYIVIHHSAADRGTVQGMDHYHRDVRHMENGLAYHFVIGNGGGMRDGEIAVGHRWIEQLDGGHLASEQQNEIALGICLVGNFDEHKPTPKQMESLRILVQALMARCKLTTLAIKTHQQINIVQTRCPGQNFSLNSLLRVLRASAR